MNAHNEDAGRTGQLLADLAIARAEAAYQLSRAVSLRELSDRVAAKLGAMILGICSHCGVRDGSPHVAFCPTRDKEFGR